MRRDATKGANERDHHAVRPAGDPTMTTARCAWCGHERPLADFLRVLAPDRAHGRSRLVCRPSRDPRCFRESVVGPASVETIELADPAEAARRLAFSRDAVPAA